MKAEIRQAAAGGIFAELKRQMPIMSLDLSGAVARRTPEGLAIEIDPDLHRKAARKAGLLVAFFFGLFAAFGVVGWRENDAWGFLAMAIGTGGIGLFALAAGFLGKPSDMRLLVAPERIALTHKGRTKREIPARDVLLIALERHEYEVHSGNRRTTRVEWPVRLALASGEVVCLTKSGDRQKARQFAEDAAIALGRAFTDATGDAPTEVRPEHVNVPLDERLRSGILRAERPGPAPARVFERDVPGGVEYAVPNRRWGQFAGFAFGGLWFTALGSFGAAVLVWVAFADGYPWASLMALFPALFALAGLAMLWGAVTSVTGESFVRVTRDGVAHGVRRFGRERAKTVSARDYEDLRVIRGLRLVADDKEEDLGFGGEPPERQRWLADAVLSAIARYA